MSVSLLHAQPTSKAQAKKVVTNWLSLSAKPLSTSMSTKISDITTYTNDSSETLYHIVSLSPEGFVVVAGDDLVEPIVAFVPNGNYKDSLDNPMGALVRNDMLNRVSYQRDLEKQRVRLNSAYHSNAHTNKAKNKWESLYDTSKNSTISGLDSISDVLVAPLLKTKWNQKTDAAGRMTYNLYTPKNYYSGCVATSLSQTLRYFEYPNTRIGTKSFSISVDGAKEERSLMGGDGLGGKHNWSLMSYGPRIDDEEARKAIGRLMSDAGVAIRMRYTSRTSAATGSDIAFVLRETFKYENVILGFNGGKNLENINDTVNPNLDANLPVPLNIVAGSSGHAVIADGYGYNADTLYHHINVGWGGSRDAWYNLPIIQAGSYKFTLIRGAIYNIYTEGKGEIVSGRVTDENGVAINGATVTATNGFSTTTNEKGIYALTKLPSNASYTIEVTKSGYVFSSKTINVGLSAEIKLPYSSPTYQVGNRWGINFYDKEGPTEPEAPIIIEEPEDGDDIYEENNIFEDAYDITDSKKDWIDGIQSDADWYKFYISPDSLSIKIDLRYKHKKGVIKLFLYNDLKNKLTKDTSKKDNAYIDYKIPASFKGGYCYIKIFKSDVGNSYKLLWDSVIKEEEEEEKKNISSSLIYYLLN